MKTIKLFLAVAALAISSSASAQFATPSNGSQQKSSSKSNKTTTMTAQRDSWTSIYGSINSPVLVWDGDSSDTDDFDGGFTLGYSSVKPMQGDLPLLLETAGEVSYSYYSEEDEDSSFDISYLNVAIPVNVIYLYAINDQITLAPYAGLCAKYGISYIEKGEIYDSEGDVRYSEKYSCYNNDDMEGDAAKRFLIGYQIGLNAHVLNRFIVGVKWQNDISELFKADNIKYRSGTSITLGYLF